MTKVYLSDRQALAFYQEKATAEFWDRHWQIDDLRRYLEASTDDGLFVPAVKRNLPPGSLVLEGGCGRGQIVHALQHHGYRAVGVDFAAETVTRVKQALPELDVRLGDVRNLPIENATLDGYISGGVIEHFWEGYTPILAEMRRTLKPGGFLFITFPYMSPLRQFKARIGGYPRKLAHELDTQKDRFYQFAFPVAQVQNDLQRLGFIACERRPLDGIKGFKDELTWFRPWLQPIYDGKRGQYLVSLLDRLFKPYAAHTVLLVMQKT